MPEVKTYCYKDSCEIVLTGFNLIQFYSCKTCKEEVSDSLKSKIEDRQKYNKKSVSEDTPKNYQDDEELLDFWSTDGGITSFFGDDV